MIELICARCGKSFFRKPSRKRIRNYCSQGCYRLTPKALNKKRPRKKERPRCDAENCLKYKDLREVYITSDVLTEDTDFEPFLPKLWAGVLCPKHREIEIRFLDALTKGGKI